MKELLLYIYNTFYEIELDNAVNEKAAAMYQDDIDRFKRKIRECVEQSIDEMKYSSDSIDVEVYGDEANLLCYEEYPEERVKELKTLMMAEELPEYEDKPSGGVLSWLGESLTRPLSTVFSI
ncbi:hypothetical protein LOD99_11347 [Oopsacas minuta]|uniref:UBC core domain-containing protein n=1 Tax=Oopsacas minuta TaxID=111878 RepID=A0AAV7K4A0_9METZ|nr:hypothetical protein LOD99_11347 [Oopsacas minuta]